MAFFLLCVTIFIMFFQPAAIWPEIAKFQPLRNVAILSLIAYFFEKKPKGVEPFFAEKINVYLILFIVAQVISAGLVWFTGGFEMFNYWLKIGVVYFLIYKLVNNEFRYRMVAMTIIAALSYLWYYSFSLFVMNYYPGVRAGGFGWYENANDLAIIMASVVPLIMYLANTSQNVMSRFGYLLLTVAFSSVVLFTGSRNGMLALLTVGLLSILYSVKINKIFRVALLCILVGGILTIGLTSILSRSDLAGTGLSGDDSAENRIDQWYAAARMVKSNPVLGIGPGEFSDQAEDFGGIHGIQAHNTLFQVFAETGLPGGIFFSLFAISPIFFMRKKMGAASPAVRFAAIALTGFWICAFFSNRYHFYILYVLVALILSAKSILRENVRTMETRL